MSTILESIAKERELLDYPKPQKPSLHQLYGAAVRNFQDMYNELSNSDEAWSFGEVNVDVQPGTDTYAISPTIRGFLGKPLLLTTYSTDPNAIERAVPFFDIQNLNFNWFFPRDWDGWNDSWTGANHTAERVSFFYDNAGAPKLRFLPVPREAARYRLKYTLGNWAENLQPESSPILANHHHLFEIRAAKDSLYMSEWEGLDRAENMERRKEIRGFLDEQEARYLPQWKRYVKEMTHDGIVFKRGWNDW